MSITNKFNTALLLNIAILFSACSSSQIREPAAVKKNDLKVYVMVGFHVDFYHSWRGDAADDSGYGQDYKIISHTIETLNKANAQKKKAKAYWDFSANHWTFGEFIPKSYPDMIAKWKSRDPQDEFIVGPFNNGANAAATKDEFTQSIEWTLSNPDGYGLKQMFKNVGMIYRPQEMNLASGQGQWLKDAGMKALVLQYATYAFNGFSNFTAPLSYEDRFNPIWYKSHESDQPIVVFPAMSPIDLINYVSLENFMTDLREKQLKGEIKRNVVIHLNMDADAISWKPVVDSKLATSIVPNTGGIGEIIDAVNKYSWADFTTPSEYLKIEQPKKEIVVTQDLADGAFDGMASWSEKEVMHSYWPFIERSRMIERFLNKEDESYKDHGTKDYWNNPGFFNRVLSLSTTHFGMSTPFVNYQRFMRMQKYVGLSLSEREKDLHSWMQEQNEFKLTDKENRIFLKEFPRYGQETFQPSQGVQTISMAIPKGSKMAPDNMDYTKSSLDKKHDLLKIYRPIGADVETLNLVEQDEVACVTGINNVLTAQDLQVEFSTDKGVKNFFYKNNNFGGDNFLSPFISFKEKILLAEGENRSKKQSVITPKNYILSSRSCSTAPNVSEVSLSTKLEFSGVKQKYTLPVDYRFWTHKELPYLFMDVKANVPFTLDEKIPSEANPQFLRHVDYRWREIALSQLIPNLKNNGKLRVWKMNYEGLVSHYDVNYEQFNPKNKNFDSLNNHLTPGWMAVSNGNKGMLIAFNTTKRSSFGAVPIRVKNTNGSKDVALNPFGSYFGEQMDYSHIGGGRLGTILANMGAQYIKPNAPGFTGEHVEYELMIAPYMGDKPAQELITAAMNFAYPAMGFIATKGELKTTIEMDSKILELERDQGEKLIAPRSLAAAGANQKIILTWQEEEGVRLDRFELLWKKKKQDPWQIVKIKASERYYEFTNLKNGEEYHVALRAVKGDKISALSNGQIVKPSTAYKNNLTAGVSINPGIIMKFLNMIYKHHTTKDPEKK